MYDQKNPFYYVVKFRMHIPYIVIYETKIFIFSAFEFEQTLLRIINLPLVPAPPLNKTISRIISYA